MPQALPPGISPQQAAALAARQARPQLPPRAQAPASPPVGRRERAVQWATEGAPSRRVGNVPQRRPPPFPPVAPPAPVQAAPQPVAPPAVSQGVGFGAFPEAAVGQLVEQLGIAIDAQTNPAQFAGSFVHTYPAESLELVRLPSAEFLRFVEQKYASSACLRREGRDWVEAMWDEILRAHDQLQAAYAEQDQQVAPATAPPPVHVSSAPNPKVDPEPAPPVVESPPIQPPESPESQE